MNKKLGFNSIAVHGGYHVREGPVNPPLDNSSTYKFASCDDGAAKFAGDKMGIYTRLGTGIVNVLCKRIALMEGGHGGHAVASGMAALRAVVDAILRPGDHTINTASMYGPSRMMFEDPKYFPNLGIETDFTDTSNPDNARELIKENTAALFIETPANPVLAITNLDEMSAIAKENDLYLVVDNTFCSPYLQRPLDHGADIVYHSLTKSIGGHSRAVGGMVISKNERDYEHMKDIVMNTGGVLSPEVANIMLAGIGTLGIRMDRMQENAMKFAEYLSADKDIAWVNYPGLATHPAYDLVKSGKQMFGPGNMMTFGFKNGYEFAKKVLDNMELFTLAVSLGGIESLIEHPASTTHCGIPEDERIKAGITPELIRVSVGIENIEDLLEDYEQAKKKSA